MFQKKDTIHPIPASIIVDEEAPALSIGSTMFWHDGEEWQTVEVTDCEPRGWGFAQIKWHTPSGWHTKPVPYTALKDLDEYIELQDDYGQFEASDMDFDDWHDRKAGHTID